VYLYSASSRSASNAKRFPYVGADLCELVHQPVISEHCEITDTD